MSVSKWQRKIPRPGCHHCSHCFQLITLHQTRLFVRKTRQFVSVPGQATGFRYSYCRWQVVQRQRKMEFVFVLFTHHQLPATQMWATVVGRANSAGWKFSPIWLCHGPGLTACSEACLNERWHVSGYDLSFSPTGAQQAKKKRQLSMRLMVCCLFASEHDDAIPPRERFGRLTGFAKEKLDW